MSDNQGQYTISIHDKAARMLYEHIRFVANVSIPAARKLRTTLYHAIYSLEEMPFRCPVYRTHRTFDNYHQLVVGRYKIIFTVNDKDMIINIKYILDTRQEDNL